MNNIILKVSTYLSIKLFFLFLGFAATAILAGIGFLSGQAFTDLNIIIAFNLIISLVTLFLLRRTKREKTPINLLLVVDLICIILTIYLNGGVESELYYLPIFIIFAADNLIGNKFGLAYALFSFIILVITIGLDYHNLIPHIYGATSSPAYWHNQAVNIAYLLSAGQIYFVAALFSGYFNQQLSVARGALDKGLNDSRHFQEEAQAVRRALMNITEDLMQTKEALQKTVRQRTLELETAKNKLEERVQERTTELEKTRRAVVHMMKDLRDDMIKLKEVDRMKTEFLSLVSHELRTPITPIKGYLALLLSGKMGEFSEEAKKAIDISRKQCEHLNSLIDNLLDISRFEMGKKIPLNTEPLALGIIVKEVAEAMQVQADERKIHIIQELPANLPTIVGDEVKIRRILTNLIGNSIKFTPEGGEIKIQALTELEVIRITVIDNGIGLAPQNIEKIFEKFYQVDASIRRKAGGIGMGLAIARELVELHGGKLWAESEGLGKGTCFAFTLPINI